MQHSRDHLIAKARAMRANYEKIAVIACELGMSERWVFTVTRGILPPKALRGYATLGEREIELARLMRQHGKGASAIAQRLNRGRRTIERLLRDAA